MSHEHFLQQAVQLAMHNVKQKNGGPFGAIVVKDGNIIGQGVNQVTENQDPTAHAEVQAIRAACKQLNHFQLAECTIYTSCEPCPMCLGAIYWARPDNVFFACTKQEAAEIGFDDQFIYEEIPLPYAQRKIKMKMIEIHDRLAPFQAWSTSLIKVEY